MRDGPVRRAVKLLARWHYELNLGLVRAWRRRGGPDPYVLEGACQACAKCCEEPSIHVGRVLWHLPSAKRLFLLWQVVVNGFVLLREERAARTLVFRCTHFDEATRRCDSYDSRPAMCRDYPRMLLDQPRPELFEGCGYRVRARGADAMLVELKRHGVGGEQHQKLKKDLYLE